MLLALETDLAFAGFALTHSVFSFAKITEYNVHKMPLLPIR